MNCSLLWQAQREQQVHQKAKQRKEIRQTDRVEGSVAANTTTVKKHILDRFI